MRRERLASFGLRVPCLFNFVQLGIAIEDFEMREERLAVSSNLIYLLITYITT